jgi:hypothetical protein
MTWCVGDSRRKGEGRGCEWSVGVQRGAGALSDCRRATVWCVHLPLPPRIALHTSPPCITLCVCRVGET